MLTKNGALPDQSVLSHGWRPETGFISYDYGSYNEAILLYLLGLGAPGELMTNDPVTTIALAREAAKLAPYQVARLRVGYVPEGRRVFPNLTVGANVGYGLVNRRAGRAVMDARVTEPTTGRTLEVWSIEPGLQFELDVAAHGLSIFF